jgi:hypothetical protein
MNLGAGPDRSLAAGSLWTRYSDDGQLRRRLDGRQSVKLPCFLGWFFLVAPLGLAAQNTSYGVVGGMNGIGPDGQANPATRTFPQLNVCPVSVQASHLSDGNIVKTGASLPGANFPKPKGIGQRLHLKLHSPDQRTIASATVNLRGWTAKGRKAQVGSSDDAALGARTLAVPFTLDADRMSSADIWAPGLTAVVSVELLSVKYTDGSTWTPVQGHACRVAPDHLMLVTQ